jgi:hypothetical protein
LSLIVEHARKVLERLQCVGLLLGRRDRLVVLEILFGRIELAFDALILECVLGLVEAGLVAVAVLLLGFVDHLSELADLVGQALLCIRKCLVGFLWVG